MGKKKKSDGKKSDSSADAPPPPKGVSEIAEAVLNFKIRTREQLIVENEDEAEVIRDKNFHQTERNKKLLVEKEQYMQTLFDKVKEEEAKLNEAKKVARNDVENALLEKLNYVHTSHQEIKEMGETIEQLDSKLAVSGEELQRIKYYKDVVLKKNNSRIEAIKAEMERIKKEGAEEGADVNEKLKVIRKDALKLTEVLIDLQQKQISERLMDSLNPEVKQELKDNVWLKREIGLQKKAFDKLSRENAFLERRNLKLMDGIHNLKMADLRAMRKVCQPELGSPPPDTSIPMLLSTNNLSWQQVAEEATATQGEIPMYTSLELRMMGVDGTRAHLATPLDSVKLPPISGKPRTAAASSRPYWPVTSNMLKTLLTSNDVSNSSQTTSP